MFRQYHKLTLPQKMLTIIGGIMLLTTMILWATRMPSERPKQKVIILNCADCGVNFDRTVSYNEYMDRKEQEQRDWITNRKQELRQEIWDNNGRARWCRNHPQDINCKGNK